MINHLVCILLLILCIGAPQFLFAQHATVEVRGEVVESEGRQPIEFATVLVVNPQTQEAIAGNTTGPDGRFSIQAKGDAFMVVIRFLGFGTATVKAISIVEGVADLGQIALTAETKTLDEVVIAGEKSQTEFKLDKRIFHVGADLSSTGASALDVLNNVPSVNVNIEGVISLRGSQGVQILINGKPSVLASEGGNALGTITADMIDRVEVITNPSAKYEAEGTSGIINIVLKKEDRKGVNGSVTLNTGAPHNHSVGLSLNRRTEKFNLFSQLGVGYRELPNDNENTNRDLLDNSVIRSSGTEYRNETFYNLILGTDYHINPYNVLTLSGHFAYEVEDQPSLTDFRFFDGQDALFAASSRDETTQATNPKWQYELQYKKDFKDHKDHVLLFSALGNFFGKDQSSEFVNTASLGDALTGNQQTKTNFKEATYTFKLDYTQPFLDKFTLETGAQYVITDVSNDFSVLDLFNGDWVPDMALTNLFEYDQKVLGVYGTGAYEGDRWGLKLGLRAENTDLNTLLANTGEANNQNFTNLFPSAHTSYKLSETFSVQAGYSRRVFRPRLWDLNPFFNVRNSFSIRTGNPDLQPEFTDSYELTSIYLMEKISLTFGIFHRFTTDMVERISLFNEGVNTVKPFNVGTNRATGAELNAKYSPLDWWTLTGDFNYLQFNRMGELAGTNFDFSGNRWTSKVTSKFKLPAQLDMEITGQYESKYKTVQSTMSGFLFADMGLRKKILNGKAVLNMSVRDIFASRIMKSETLQPNFYLYNRSLRGRFITLGFSYGFGKGEAMEFSGQKRL